jgi:negative regulator of flagellin synthesis FlgM
MSPIDTSGIKPGPRLDTERLDTRVRGGNNSEQEGTPDLTRADSVQLTDTAARLAELQGEVAAAPGVDLGRVEEIRQQIADGSYEIDADRVADALMTMEKELL